MKILALWLKLAGTHITHVATEVEVRSLASNLPQFIEVDLAKLSAGQSIHLSDLALPAGVKLEKLLRGDDAVVLIAGGITQKLQTLRSYLLQMFLLLKVLPLSNLG